MSDLSTSGSAAGLSVVPGSAVAEWLSVDEFLPVYDEIVWLFDPETGPLLGCLTEDAGMCCWARSDGCIWWNGKAWDGDCETDDLAPSHWLPLPIPPNDGTQPRTMDTDRDRWIALKKPEVICRHCWFVGPDDGPDRVCEACGEHEPEGDAHGQHCPACDREVWWISKCPACGKGMCWTYGGIGPTEFERVSEANVQVSHAREERQ